MDVEGDAEPREDDAVAREQASYKTIHDSLLRQSLSSGRQDEEASGGVAAWKPASATRNCSTRPTPRTAIP